MPVVDDRCSLRAGPPMRMLHDHAWTWLHFDLVKNSIICLGSEIGHFWGLGGPGGFGDPSEGWGAKPPTFLKGLQGPQGHPDPQNDRLPILKQVSIFLTKPKCTHVDVSCLSVSLFVGLSACPSICVSVCCLKLLVHACNLFDACRVMLVRHER